MNAKWYDPIRKILYGIAMGGLILSLCLGSNGAPVVRAHAAWADSPAGAVSAPLPLPQLAYGAPGWKQANTSGFGDTKDEIVSSLEVYNNQLYAGTGNFSEGGQVWRSSNGMSFSPVFPLMNERPSSTAFAENATYARKSRMSETASGASTILSGFW